jgi:transcriptional regulator with XRE-family HTH domain
MSENEYTGARLKELRKRARLTQTRVYKLCGVTSTCVGYLEQGKHKPQYETLQKLLNLYAQRIKSIEQLDQFLKETAKQNGKVDTKAPEWRRGSGVADERNLQAPVQSRAFSQPQGVLGVQRPRKD